MPVKDTEKYLDECLASIRAQTFEDWELIAVNDDSTDNSPSILRKYASLDSRVIVVDNKNPSLLNALRLGYSVSRGSHIQRMDSDDIMPNYKLSKMYAAWSEFGKGCVITGGTKYFSDEGEVGDGFKRYDSWLCDVAENNSHPINIYRECVIPSSCWLVHRDDFDELGSFEPEVFPEDYDLCFRFYKQGLQIIGLKEVLHYWRDRDDRISRTWDVYKDNRFFELKMAYFYEIERDTKRPLVLWGAGKNGKDLAKIISKKELEFIWVCDNENKIGKEIYSTYLKKYTCLPQYDNPQIIIAVASPEGQLEIQSYMDKLKLVEGKNWWFFS